VISLTDGVFSLYQNLNKRTVIEKKKDFRRQ